jgi:tRNA(Glu) U13 pseudouridine synthase TruD
MIRGFLKSFNIKGDWRSVIGEVEEPKICIKKFDNWQGDLLSLDSHNEFFDICDEGKFTYVILQFVLKKSNYATMALREFLNCDISFENQCIIKDIIFSQFINQEEVKLEKISENNNKE